MGGTCPAGFIGDFKMIGKTISHYRILEEIGRGGMPSIIKKYNSLVPPNKMADQQTDPRSGRCRK